MPRLLQSSAAALASLLVLAACGAPQTSDSKTAVGHQMKLKAEQLATGAPFELASLRGRVCLVDVWASWCAPCREALPFFAELHGRHAKAGLEVVALSVDEERSAAKDFVAPLKLPFVLLWDRNQAAVAGLDVAKMPTSFLVDRQGKVRALYAGFRADDRAVIEREVVALLAEAATGTGD